MLLGVVVWVAGIVVKVAACLEGTHGCLLEGGTGENLDSYNKIYSTYIYIPPKDDGMYIWYVYITEI